LIVSINSDGGIFFSSADWFLLGEIFFSY